MDRIFADQIDWADRVELWTPLTLLTNLLYKGQLLIQYLRNINMAQNQKPSSKLAIVLFFNHCLLSFCVCWLDGDCKSINKVFGKYLLI